MDLLHGPAKPQGRSYTYVDVPTLGLNPLDLHKQTDIKTVKWNQSDKRMNEKNDSNKSRTSWNNKTKMIRGWEYHFLERRGYRQKGPRIYYYFQYYSVPNYRKPTTKRRELHWNL